MDNENSNQSIINAAFVAAGFLIYFAVAMLFDTLAGAFGPVARLYGQDMFKHGIPVGIGLAGFLALILKKECHVFADEAITEVRKVVWPSRKDTTAMTIVCCVMCVVAGIGFGVFDFFASQLIKVFVN